MKVLYILSPNDRFNYGDLLFAPILKNYFGDYFDKIIYCSTTSADLTSLGGMRVESFSRLYEANDKDENYLIVGGGECLCVRWSTILSYIYPGINKAKKILNIKWVRKYVPGLLDIYIKYKYNVKTLFPFTVGKNELNTFNVIIYNSVGGVNVNNKISRIHNKKIINVLSSVDYISVRDEQAHSFLSNIGIESNLVADSAILMSDVFSESFLHDRCRQDFKTISSYNYIFFQINYKYSKSATKHISEALNSINKTTGYKIVLCPIGTALSHSDHIALASIASYMDKDSYFLIEQPSVWEIMWLIQHSKLYSGCSLHGTITAMSFNVPFVAYGPLKLSSYLKQWDPENTSSHFVEINNLEGAILKELSEKTMYSPEKQKMTVVASFEVMKHLIQ